MGLPTFLILFIIVCWDIINLKRLNALIFYDEFKRLNLISFVFFSFVGIMCFVFETPLDEWVVYLIGAIMSVYLSGRQKILTRIKRFRNNNPNPYILTADFLYVLIMWLFSSLVFSLVTYNCGLLFPDYVKEIDEILYTTIFSTIFIIYLIDQAVRSLDDKGFWFHVGLSENKKSNFVVYFLPAAIGIMFAFSSVALMFVRPENPQTPLSTILEDVTSPFSIMLFLFLAMLVAPFVEEIIFRGYFYNMFSRITGKRLALYIISLSFGLMHMGQYWGDWAAIGIVTVLGFALTIMRDISGTTLSSIIMHYAYNGGVAIISIVLIIRDNPQLTQQLAVLLEL